MGRSMWSGVISFGMVTIPVKLHSATESSGVAFHQLHEKCDTRIKEQRWCPHCERVVEWAEIVKGYEYAKGEYVEVTDEDFAKLPLPSKHTIEVASFVDVNEIDPIYYDSTYYLEVEEKGSQKPYKLLTRVMESKNVAGVASITFRNKERLCVLRLVGGRMVLQTLLYADEIKPSESSVPAAVSVSAQETKMAESLVAALKGKFEPGKFKDKYQAALKKLIQAKLKGVEIKQIEPNEPTAPTDLMAALQASLDKAKQGSHASGSAKGRSAVAAKTVTTAASGTKARSSNAKRPKSATSKSSHKKKGAA